MWYNYCGGHYIYCSRTVSVAVAAKKKHLMTFFATFSHFFPFCLHCRQFQFLFFFPLLLLISRRRSRKMQSLNQQKSPLPIAGLPVNCCGPNGSPGPLGSIATLSAFNHHKVIKNDSFASRIGRYRKVKNTQL